MACVIVAAVADDADRAALIGAHKKPAVLATAALMDIIAQARAIEAAALRNASPEDQAALRQRGHDLLDAYFDLTAEAATAVRLLIDP